MIKRTPPLYLLALPLVTVFILGLSVFLSSKDQPLEFARVHGGPTDSKGGLRGRIELSREVHGSILPLEDSRFRLTAQQGDHHFSRILTTGPEGWAEFELPRFVEHAVELTVFGRNDEVLARGAPSLRAVDWAQQARRRGGALKVHKKGKLSAQLKVPQGILSVPFTSRVQLHVSWDNRPITHAKVSVDGEGLELIGASTGSTDQSGDWWFVVRPQHHSVALQVRIEKELISFSFNQVLPLVAGSLMLRRPPSPGPPESEQGEWWIESPIPRDAAWFTLVSEQERLTGGRIPLHESENGLFVGGFVPPEDQKEIAEYIVLASTADGYSSGTVGYPLKEQGVTFDARDSLLIDGYPARRARADGASQRLTWILSIYAALSGLLTLALFYVRIKKEENALSEALKLVHSTPESQERSPLPLVIAILSLFFAFSLCVLWIVAR